MPLQILLFAIAAAFLIAVIIGPLFIPVLRRLKFGQSIREEGPSSHLKKAGTPTMGGTIILLALSFTVLKFANASYDIFLLMFVTLGFGMIGFLDDFIKITTRRNLGLTARQKLIGQLLIALVFFYFLMEKNHLTAIYIPGTNWGIELNWLYLPFVVFIMIGSANALNLTDGLDGLLAGTAAVAFGAFAITSWLASYIDIAIFSAAVAGALLGFLVFNAHPAKVFMGDTGSLALGGALAAVAILTKMEVLLAVIGGLFVLETLSVVLQVASFKLSGRRIFRMSPLHHHFELGGWSEWRVVVTFWIVSIMFAGLGVYLQVWK